VSFAPPSWWPRETVACFEDLLSYRLVGASACADRFTSALIRLADQAEEDGRDVAAGLDEAGRAFCALKPDTALYVNVVELLARANHNDRALDVCDRALWLGAYRRQAQRQIIQQASRVLEEAELLLVHDYSSSVMQVLSELARRRPRRVIVTAGEPLGQGARVADIVGSLGHQVIYTPDMSVGRVIKGADAFITGVESFYADGSLANTVGTMMLGLLCREHAIPVIAPTECLKLDRQRDCVEMDDLSARMLKPWPPEGRSDTADWCIEDHVLDAVPSSLVSTYVTEAGTCSADDVGGAALKVWVDLSAGPSIPLQPQRRPLGNG
jgi:ribose 1,5-bisphosphate isomerase